ncbi:MAG TPA: tetrahydromethanopterin S-methyltransferase subunit D [archaeon]|jgi:tetrahydromethanopterin S-methyltransferase subunit D|nr:tetrahydromethanopterin S-methyltransferase subunit D [archaeon]
MIDPITTIVLITLGGVLVGLGVHFIPVGGAPAAMAQATGVGTGTVQLAAGAGLTGLISAGFMYNELATSTGLTNSNMILVLASGAVGAMIMITVTMFIGQLIYVYGVGVPPVSAKVKKDPITGDVQDIYVSKGTEGHGIPTVSFVSGTIGGLLGGLGGSLIYIQLMNIGGDHTNSGIVALAGIFATGVFYVNSVIASYNIGGTIEGFHDPKFKRVPKAIVSCLIASLLCAIIAVPIMGGVA